MAIADRLDHVSIATWKIASMVPLVRDVLGARFLMGAEDPALRFRWAQFQLPGGGIIELLEPTDDQGFLHRFLKERGEGLHHLTLRVRDIRTRMQELEAAGYHAVKARLDDPNWREAFIHPKDAHGVLIQLAESELPYPEEIKLYQQLDLGLLES
ncbi:MAG TPA: VOC family protein [Candidatus Limnocylindrales bacterium]|nr:VOC family protein [Candidatus Limnocylindrales bacterium]